MTKPVIPPVRISVRVARAPEDVFRVFTEDMRLWWPLQTHSVAADTFEGKVRAETVVFEGRVGGRIYERMEDGREAEWGQVLVWEPPRRVVFSWKPNLNPVPPTEIEVTFVPEGSGTRVDLEHRGWERLGEEGLRKRQGYETGWPGVLDRFAAHFGNTLARQEVFTEHAQGRIQMIKKQPWFERQFPTSLPATLFPIIVERLRGTPARLADRLGPLSAALLTRRAGSAWSIQENAGHLLDLEPLWLQRVDDLLARRPEMTPADLENRRTHEANHNAAPLATLLGGFRRARMSLVNRLETVDDAALAYTALHPRLRLPMSLVDHVFFVAEHDDYHLARVSELLREFGAS